MMELVITKFMVREKESRRRKQRQSRFMLSVLWIRATLAWVLLSCHDLGTKLIINKREFQ